MSESSERVESALAAYLDFLEMGGVEPDVSHFTSSEREEFDELVGLLELSKNVPLGVGRREAETVAPADRAGAVAKPVAHLSRLGRDDRLATLLKEALPVDVRVTAAPIVSMPSIGGVEVLGGWIVGTFGGRLRVLLFASGSAAELENTINLEEVGRAFRMLPDTVAIALVAEDFSCLLVEPEDCAPSIEVPGGSLLGRHFRRPIQAVEDAVSAFVRELVPYWDPIPGFDREVGVGIDVSSIAKESAQVAIEEQQGIGGRARKTNPKRKALTELGKREVDEVARIAIGLYEKRMEPVDVKPRLTKLARAR